MHKSPLAETLLAVLNRHAISTSETLIVAVSGGCDSMALLALSAQCKLPVIAAHVNYGLRGEDSDADEVLVFDFCQQQHITLEKLIVTDEQWNNDRGSTQEQARAIRYAWFAELQQKYQASRVMTAHHANDQTETMFMQFMRGGSGKSVYGMAEDKGFILRPLLAHTKEELLAFAQTHHIPWREDRSNQTDAYTRNSIRHRVMPLIEQINPGIHHDIQQRSRRMHEEQRLAEQAAQSTLAELIQTDRAGRELMDTPALLATKAYLTLLWKWLAPSQFSSHAVEQIADHLERGGSSEAAWYHSETHDVCIQNNTICLANKTQEQRFTIHELPWAKSDGFAFTLSLKASNDIQFTPDHISQSLNASLLKFPLIIRTWKEGDVLKPLGANGRKKVSDLLTQVKMPAWEKRDVLVLEADETIAAVIGVRISETFKVSAETADILQIEFPPV
ncbi:MAG: tRNA lysidine(34) synthetase TilS [Flavobacteriales bacterium]|jgi:tRNA(Ile)-lysidine synthase